VLSALCLSVYFNAAPLEPTIGWLQAANEPIPQNGCGNPGIGVLMVFGDNGVVLSGSVSAKKSTALELGNCALLSIRAGENGALIDAMIYDRAGKTLAQIIDNRFSIPVENALTIEKSGDLSTLVVHDAQGREMLYVRYLNRKTFRVRGIFSCPTPRPRTVIITDTRVSGLPFEMSCAENNASGFSLQ
jgi:hypothetical protein